MVRTLVQIGIIFITVLGLWIGARLLVDAVVRLAQRFGISDLTIGLTIVAMGTSTPELFLGRSGSHVGRPSTLPGGGRVVRHLRNRSLDSGYLRPRRLSRF